MKKQILILFFLVVATISFAQINKFDAKGKKQGKWTSYLDKYWNVLEDSSNAVYYRYTYYDAGINVQPMGPGGKHKMWKMKTEVDTSIQKGIKILNGDYRWHDPKGRLMYWHIFKDGVYESYKEFYESGELQTHIDYNKHIEGQKWSWYKTSYDKKGNIISEGFTKKDEKGIWTPMK